MIDLHTHTILSDGELLPSELVRRAEVAGYSAIAITDHVDQSNIDFVLSGLTRVAKVLNKYWNITVLPGVELTHVALETFPSLVRHARKKGAKIVIAHGESPVEPVIPGTNRAAIKAGIDILAHPGFILEEDARLAAKKGVYLEITCRRGHMNGNKHVFDAAMKAGAKMVINTDSHAPGDLLTQERFREVLSSLTDDDKAGEAIKNNSEELVSKAKRR
jgi:putative hydrolase